MIYQWRLIMACRPLKSVNFNKFKTSLEILREIQAQIDELKEIAVHTNFDDEKESDQFSRNVLFLKSYFETYERLLENE